jgi:hypothetical protein
MYADGFFNSMIDDKDGHIPSQLIMVNCTPLREAFLSGYMKKGVDMNGSKS